MIDINMGYVGAKTNPGRIRNVVFDGIHGIGPTGGSMSARGLVSASNCTGCNEHIQNLTIKNVNLQTGGDWLCTYVDGVDMENVKPLSEKSTCK